MPTWGTSLPLHCPYPFQSYYILHSNNPPDTRRPQGHLPLRGLGRQLEAVVDAAFSRRNGQRMVHLSWGILPPEVQTLLPSGWYSSWFFERRGELHDVLNMFL